MPGFKLLFAVMLLFYCSLSYSFPRGCEVKDFGFEQGQLVLNEAGGQTFYLIQNRTTLPIELQRYETQEAFMSPPLTARLGAGAWSAFASDIAHLHFQCFSREAESLTQIDCREALDICQYPRVKFALSNMGNYWVSVNKNQMDVLNEATAKGIYLRW